MNIAEAFNTQFTLARMNPARAPRTLQVQDDAYAARVRAAKVWNDAKFGTAEVEADNFIAACVLEHQHGLYRSFAAATGALLHSHECRVEVIRRCERDGFHFIHAPA